ncbi:ABC transporter ATP-binding protein [Cellulosilyticum sp. I15G10I2]|uniref:ABC transporter ATP-binding protein n=1 Tax=Cellulosilyticum sp. I15G10I2 TaxID=1892843 RepID=UPI00085BC948|nr:ABC transporter ATP-binding protein [Cellulosilyticum sp. I15G10I2]
MSSLLEVNHLSVSTRQKGHEKVLVSDVSFTVEKGRCLGILGESGSGKSMTCKAIMGLLDHNYKITGSVQLSGRELTEMSGEKKRTLRGKDMCMILQNPMNCFDPLYRIGTQMEETFRTHTRLSSKEIQLQSVDILERMQIKNPEDVLKKYPHQFSGGMLQRVMIGLALALKPKLIIADEPTTAIDSITQFEIIKEFIRLKQELDAAIIFVTHDLGIITQLADDVVIMHKGIAVEQGPLRDVFRHAVDPYTRMLIEKRMAVMNQFERVVYQRG